MQRIIYFFKNHSQLWYFLAVIFPLSIFTLILFNYKNYLPLWDSRSYFTSCIFPAISQPFNLLGFNCSNHGSLVYGLIYSFLQYFNLGSIYFIHLTSFVLILSAFYFYYLILKLLFKNLAWIFLGLALVFWNPAIVANALNPTPDLTVFAFSIIALWSFLTRRIILAASMGIALLFSKEAGVIYYSLCAFFYLYYYRQKKTALVKEISILITPLILYAFFMWYKTHIANQALLFLDFKISDLLAQLFFINWNDPYFNSALSAMFLLNFQWLVAGVLIIGMINLCIRVFSKSQVPKTSHHFLPVEFIFLLTFSFCYILARFPHFLNVRYYLPIFPLTTLLFIAILKNFFPRLPSLLLGGTLISLFLLSCFFTIDPVSRSFYGTFNFGKHKLLRMTSVTAECCGYGRDQLVYNLQHIEMQKLLNQFFQLQKIKPNDVILVPQESAYFIFGNVNPDNYALTLKNKDVYQPIYLYDSHILENLLKTKKISRIFYIKFPNVQDKNLLTKITSFVKNFSEGEVKNKGYHLSFLKLESYR